MRAFNRSHLKAMNKGTIMSTAKIVLITGVYLPEDDDD